MTIEVWDRPKRTFEFWVGQDAGVGWGPLGMDDSVYLKYIPGSEEET